MSQNYNSSVPFQRDSSYILRTLNVEFKPSNGGNPMFAFEFEVVEPQIMTVGDSEYNIAGTKVRAWQVVKTMDGDSVDVVKTQRNNNACKKLVKAYGGDPETYDFENPDLTLFKDKLVFALLEDNEQEKRKSPTAAQLKAGQKQGDVLLNPVTKKPLTTHGPKLGNDNDALAIFGLATVEAGAAY
jgi:hypothetical protein